jgi:hypothetical protein
MMGAFFQYEKTLLVAKLKGARKRMRDAEGSCEGRKAFGDRPGEQATIKIILDLRKTGLAMDTIAETLNSRGVKSRTGGK